MRRPKVASDSESKSETVTLMGEQDFDVDIELPSGKVDEDVVVALLRSV